MGRGRVGANASAHERVIDDIYQAAAASTAGLLGRMASEAIFLAHGGGLDGLLGWRRRLRLPFQRRRRGRQPRGALQRSKSGTAILGVATAAPSHASASRAAWPLRALAALREDVPRLGLVHVVQCRPVLPIAPSQDPPRPALASRLLHARFEPAFHRSRCVRVCDCTPNPRTAHPPPTSPHQGAGRDGRASKEEAQATGRLHHHPLCMSARAQATRSGPASKHCPTSQLIPEPHVVVMQYSSLVWSGLVWSFPQRRMC